MDSLSCQDRSDTAVLGERASGAALIEALQQLLFPGRAVEHLRLALRLRQIADVLVAAEPADCGRAGHAEHGCEAGSLDTAKTRPPRNGVQTACNGAGAGKEEAEAQPADVERQLQSCRPPRNLGKAKKHRGVQA